MDGVQRSSVVRAIWTRLGPGEGLRFFPVIVGVEGMEEVVGH
jgi:hypothetical protein